MKFNINDIVRVRLNERGHTIMKRNWNSLGLDRFGPFKRKEEDKDGWSSFQMWDLMNQFGADMILGTQPPFDTEIELEQK